MSRPRPGSIEAGPWDLVADLMDTARNDEAEQVEWLQGLIVRSGWAWRCEETDCGAVVDSDEESCANCGAARPEQTDILGR